MARDFDYRVSRIARIDDLQLDVTECGTTATPIPRHFHERPLLALVVRGPVIEVRRGSTATFVAGSVMYLPPGDPHAVAWPAGTARVFSLELGPKWLSSMTGARGIPIDPLRPPSPWIHGAATRLYRRFVSGRAEAPFEIEGAVLALLSPPLDSARRVTRSAPAWLRRARELVADRACESLRLRDVASEVGVHPVTLSRAFRATYGVTLSTFLQDRRLELARVALATSELHVGGIAIAHGFADHAHFSRTFKRLLGLTPTAYRAALGRRVARRRPVVSPLASPRRHVVSLRASDAGIFAT